MIRSSLVFVLILLVGQQLVAQEGMTQRNAHFSVIGGYRSKDTSFIIIDGGVRQGVKVGENAYTFSIYLNKDGKDVRKHENIGYGKVISVFLDSSICTMNQVKTGSLYDSVLLGDVVKVAIDIPRKKYPSIYLDLALLNVFFKDVDDKYIYNLEVLYDMDTSILDRIFVDYVTTDMKKTYELYKDGNLSAELKQPMTSEGRFKGKVPLRMLVEATPADIQSFLQYVHTYPAKYMGQNYKFAEVFVTWVMNNASYSPKEVADALFPVYKDQAKFNDLLKIYGPSITSEGMISGFADSINTSFARGDEEAAATYREFGWKLADVFKDTGGRASIMLALAYNAYDAHNYRQTVIYTDSALYYAKQVGWIGVEMDAYQKKSEALAQIPNTAEARNVLKEMEASIGRNKTKLDPEVSRSFLQLRYQYDGWVNYSAGEYATAIKMYTVAADMNNQIKTYKSRSNNALIFKNLGLIYKAQGKNSEAIRSFSSASAIYDSLNSIADKAYVWNEIGAVNYNGGNYTEAMKWFEAGSAINRELGDMDNLGYAVSMKAQCYWMLGKIDSAIVLHKEAIDYRRKVNASGTAFSWDQLGQLYQVNAFKTEALNAYDSSRIIYETLKDSASLSDNYINVGLVYHGDENYKKAINYYEKALGSNSKTSSTALFNIGLAWSELDKRKGIGYLEKAEKACDLSKDLALQFKALNQLTSENYSINAFTKGDMYYGKMEKLLKEIGTPARKAQMFQLKALRYIKTNKLDSALIAYTAALAIYDSVSKLDAVTVMIQISTVYTSNGRFTESMNWIRRALSYAKDAGSPLGEGLSYSQMGFLYGETGELDKGLAVLDSAAAIFIKHGNALRFAGTRIDRGMLYKDKGDYKTALEYIFYADSVYIAEGTEDYRKTTMNNAGVVYFQQSDYNRAIEYFLKAEQYYDKSLAEENVLITRSNIAECYYHQKKYKESLEILNEYYPLAVKNSYIRIAMRMANILGKMYYDQGNIAKAQEYTRQAYDFADKSGSAEDMMIAMVFLGKIDLQNGNPAGAEKRIRAALEKTKTLGLGEQWEAHYELGMVYYSQRKYDSAIVQFKQAVEQVEKNAGNVYGGEEARKLFTSDSRKVDLYNKIIASFVAVKDPAKASEYALRNSITALNSKYGKDLGFADSTLKADLVKAEEYQRQISAVDVSIANTDNKEKKEALLKTKRILEEGYQNFLDERKEKYNDFAKYLRGGVNPEDLSNYKGGLPDDMAVISYVINDSQLYKFIVTNSTLEIVTTVLDEDINVMVNEFISALSAPDSASGTGALKVRADFADAQKYSKKSFKETSEKLYHVLIEDLLPVIGGKKKLCIIPSGKLSNIPFQCLGKTTAGKFHFLLEDYRVFYTNRMDMFRSKEVSDRNISNMAAFGNPDRSLEYAKQEVMDIQKISHTKQVYIEEKATEREARVALGQTKYIHFATHGTLDYVKPKQSYLTFTATPGGGDDGRLTISEIDSLISPARYAELITLSACETASPLAISEDWYVSPANSFLRKKFKTVVASLWKVNDEATGLLMSEFYKNLGKMEKLDALRMAQEKLSKDPRYVHPYYWGGFVLYGDWR